GAPRAPCVARSVVRFVVGVAFLLGSILVGLAAGPVHVGLWPSVVSAVGHLPFVHLHSGLSAEDDAILWQLRAPRVILGLLVGGVLALAGASYQGGFRNPPPDPYPLPVAPGGRARP